MSVFQDTEAIENPLREGLNLERTPVPCTIIIFGASGDLTYRKLIPALYDLGYERMLPAGFSVVGYAHTDYTTETFIEHLHEGVKQFARNPVPNGVMSNMMLDKMEELGGIEFDHADMAFARELQASIPADMIELDAEKVIKGAKEGTTREDIGDVLCENVIRPSDEFSLMHGSSEVGDVSQITPTANLLTCCHPLGTPGHSWQTVAASGSTVGFKGMDFAAKAMALTGFELMTNPEALKAAREEFMDSTGGKQYTSPLPDDALPR